MLFHNDVTGRESIAAELVLGCKCMTVHNEYTNSCVEMVFFFVVSKHIVYNPGAL